jgi:molybdenum cofactor biosynthesis enzyme MoaA
MSLDTFRLLGGTFLRCGMVYLQGWGEPLAHPQLFEMVRLAKAAGCRVGMTTNGMQLDRRTCARLVWEGVDLVAFSLAGTDEGNDGVRKGTRFCRVEEAIRTLQRTKRLLGSALPAVHLAYLLLQSRWQDIMALPSLMQRLGVQQAVISTLDFVAAPSLAAEAILPATQETYEVAKAALQEVAEAGRAAGLDIRYWLASPPPEDGEEEQACDSGARIGLPWLVAQRPTCTENIHRSAFVGADGAVSPCVYAAVPVGEATHVVGGGERSYARMSFGNIHDAPFETVWRARPYAGFRAAHRKGDLPERCRDCPRPRMSAGG